MRRIAKLIAHIDTVYHYQLNDGSEVTSLQEFAPNERVRTWYDDTYHMTKIGKVCPTCNKPAKDQAELDLHQKTH